MARKAGTLVVLPLVLKTTTFPDAQVAVRNDLMGNRVHALEVEVLLGVVYGGGDSGVVEFPCALVKGGLTVGQQVPQTFAAPYPSPLGREEPGLRQSPVASGA